MNRKTEFQNAYQNGQPIILVGMDGHKNTIVASAQNIINGEVKEAKMAYNSKRVIKFINELKSEFGQDAYILAGYEAGPTGNGLKKALDEQGINCDIIPLKYVLAHRLNSRIKTDRRDAEAIVKTLKEQEYKPTYVPKDQDEQVKYFIRLREDIVNETKRVKQQINSFCLSHDITYKSKKNKKGIKWSDEHLKFLSNLKLDDLDQMTLDHYLLRLEQNLLTIKTLDKKIKQIAQSKEYRDRVNRLRCFKGIDHLIALALIVEIGDFSRFDKPGQLASFIGLVPGEHSTGGNRNGLGLTKTGNKFLRKLLILAAQGAARGKGGLKKDTRLQKENSALMLAYAERANNRLHSKFYHMVVGCSKHRNVAIAALAREIICFCWGAMTDHII